MVMAHVLGALTAAVVGLGSTIWAQINDGGGGDIVPWAQVGGIATAITALAYVAKLLADGKLVAVPISDLARRAEERDQALAELVRESHLREQTYINFLMEGRQRP